MKTLINESKVKELFNERLTRIVKIVNYKYIWSDYLEEMIPEKVVYKNEVYYWNEEDLIYYNIATDEDALTLDFVLENI